MNDPAGLKLSGMHRRYSLIFFALIAALMVLQELYGAPHSPNVWEFFGW